MKHTRRFLFLICAGLLLLGQSNSASGETKRIVSNTTDWKLSETWENGPNSWADWTGVSSVPGTFTITPRVHPSVPSNYISPVPESVWLFAESGVRYYRTTFNLPSFGAITSDIQLSVDNCVQIFVNGHALALEKSVDGANFYNTSPHHRIFVAEDGSVINPYLGEQAFDEVASKFLMSNWREGKNELILAVMNLSGTDAGCFTFGMTIETTPPVNQLPIANAGPDQVVVVGETVKLNGSGSSDPDNDNTLTYAWKLISSPIGSSGSLLNSSAVNPTLVPDVAGDYVFDLVVNDGTVDSNSDQVVITALALTNGVSGSITTTWDALVLDHVLSPAEVQAEYLLTTPRFKPNDPNWQNPRPASVTARHPWQEYVSWQADWIYVQPDYNSVGNEGQNWTKYSQAIQGFGPATLQFVSDEKVWAYLDDQFIGSGAGWPAPLPITLSGTHILTIVLFDSGGLGGIAFRVLTANQPPVANAGSDQTIEVVGPQGTSVTIDGSSSSDPDGDALTFAWSAEGIVFDQENATSATPTVTFPKGTTTVHLTVTDPSGESSTDQVNIVVQDTTPPVVTVPAAVTVEATGPNTPVNYW